MTTRFQFPNNCPSNLPGALTGIIQKISLNCIRITEQPRTEGNWNTLPNHILETSSDWEGGGHRLYNFCSPFPLLYRECASSKFSTNIQNFVDQTTVRTCSQEHTREKCSMREKCLLVTFFQQKFIIPYFCHPNKPDASNHKEGPTACMLVFIRSFSLHTRL